MGAGGGVVGLAQRAMRVKVTNTSAALQHSQVRNFHSLPLLRPRWDSAQRAAGRRLYLSQQTNISKTKPCGGFGRPPFHRTIYIPIFSLSKLQGSTWPASVTRGCRQRTKILTLRLIGSWPPVAAKS